MPKRTILADPDRVFIVEMIDAEMEQAKDCIQKAKVLAALLNALDTTGDKIEIEDNVVVGIFSKPR